MSGVVDAYTAAFIPGTSEKGGDYPESNRQRQDGYLKLDYLNLEHLWPQISFHRLLPMLVDLHCLLPVSFYVNEVRGNLPFGEVKGKPTYSNSGGTKMGEGVFEPPDAYKGRIARAMLYFYTRYYDQKIEGFDVYFGSRIEMFLRWNREHPPDAEELRRNDLVEEIQHNRNPFVDDFRLADLVGVAGFSRPPPSAAHAPPISPHSSVKSFGVSRPISPRKAFFVANDAGVRISGDAAVRYQKVNNLIAWLEDINVDISQSLGVIHGALRDIFAKTSVLEAISKNRGLTPVDPRAPKMLRWVDAMLTDSTKTKQIVVHTYRVPLPHGQSLQVQVDAGILSADAFVDEAVRLFRRGGPAEKTAGRLDEVVLVFDTGGYLNIKKHLMERGKEAARLTSGRIVFRFQEHVAPIPKDALTLRRQLNDLMKRYQGPFLSKIIEDVINLRYPHLLQQLQSIASQHQEQR